MSPCLQPVALGHFWGHTAPWWPYHLPSKASGLGYHLCGNQQGLLFCKCGPHRAGRCPESHSQPEVGLLLFSRSDVSDCDPGDCSIKHIQSNNSRCSLWCQKLCPLLTRGVLVTGHLGPEGSFFFFFNMKHGFFPWPGHCSGALQWELYRSPLRPKAMLKHREVMTDPVVEWFQVFILPL